MIAPAQHTSERATCDLCPQACVLAEGHVGKCRARSARDGSVVPQNYGRVTSMALDPIEKKPLARFYPGTRILSIGSYGCNLSCPFCQNASIAQVGQDEVLWHSFAPEDIVAKASALRAQGNIGIAFTYNEPLVGFEFVRDCALLAHEQGLKTVLVSNGYVNPHRLKELEGLIDAANIDLKGFSEHFYAMVGAKNGLRTVMNTIQQLAEWPSCHLEVTTLVVPGENDSEEDMVACASWLASLSSDIPYHVTRFFPCHNMKDKDATPRRSVYALADVARRYLAHVYVGNC